MPKIISFVADSSRAASAGNLSIYMISMKLKDILNFIYRNCDTKIAFENDYNFGISVNTKLF